MTIRSMPTTDAYRKGWDEIFGAESKTQAKRLAAQNEACPQCKLSRGLHKMDCTQPMKARELLVESNRGG